MKKRGAGRLGGVFLLCFLMSGMFGAGAAASETVQSGTPESVAVQVDAAQAVAPVQADAAQAVTPGSAAAQPDASQAVTAGEAGVQPDGWIDKTYYRRDGELLKSQWLIVGKDRYYFGKTGKVQKKKWLTIGKGRYYFTKSGKVQRGTAVVKGKLYSFHSKTGKLNKAKTKKIQAAAKYRKNFATLKKLIGKPKKSRYYSGSCYGPGKDGVLKYTGFTVYTYKYGGKEIFMGVE